MAEPLFRSVAPLWPSIPVPALGYSQAPVANGPQTLLGQTLMGPELGSGFMGPGVLTTGLTPPSLLATVAVRRGQPLGPSNEQEVEDFIYDALDLLPGTSDVEVRVEAGKATLTGTVHHKRIKRDAGEIAWAIPALNDVQNNVTIASRRRSRTQGREVETTPSAVPGGRKQV